MIQQSCIKNIKLIRLSNHLNLKKKSSILGANPSNETEYWVNVAKDVSPGNDILWNNQQIDWRFESPSDLITKSGPSQAGATLHYDSLPSYLSNLLPLPGTNELSSDDGNTLYLPKSTLVYMVKKKKEGKVDIDGWTSTGDEGYYLGQNISESFLIYKKIMKPGAHQIYHLDALFLFVEGK